MSARWHSGRASRSRGLILSIVLLSGITGLTAGRGNLGSPRPDICCSSVSVTADGVLFSETILPGDSTVIFRNRLVATIDAHPSFSASAYVDPLDPNDVSFQVTRQTGARLSSIQISEDGAVLDTLGVGAANPKSLATIAQATAITGLDSDGNAGTQPFYTLTIRLNTLSTYSRTYDTSVPPNNSFTGLNNSVKADLQAAGFKVTQLAGSISLSKDGALFTSVKQISTDTGFTTFSAKVDLTPAPTPSATTGVPTLSQTGMFVLVAILTVSAILILRRKGSGERPEPR